MTGAMRSADLQRRLAKGQAHLVALGLSLGSRMTYGTRAGHIVTSTGRAVNCGEVQRGTKPLVTLGLGEVRCQAECAVREPPAVCPATSLQVLRAASRTRTRARRRIDPHCARWSCGRNDAGRLAVRQWWLNVSGSSRVVPDPPCGRSGQSPGWGAGITPPAPPPEPHRLSCWPERLGLGTLAECRACPGSNRWSYCHVCTCVLRVFPFHEIALEPPVRAPTPMITALFKICVTWTSAVKEWNLPLKR